MGKTIIEKIIGAHADKEVSPGEIVDITIDVRAARDFGGANVVKNLRDNALPIADASKTVFTFDCNPGGSDQKYATNQQLCRDFARGEDIEVYDIDAGIGTHVAIDDGLALPGSTFVSTDSHANIMGAIGAFGQGMGDVDIAQAFAFGKVWFKVPPSVKVILKGRPSPLASAKDITLAMAKVTGANGLLGYAAEIYGDGPLGGTVSEWIRERDLQNSVSLMGFGEAGRGFGEKGGGEKGGATSPRMRGGPHNRCRKCVFVPPRGR